MGAWYPSAAGGLALPTALTDADDRITAAISAAGAVSTRRVYAYTWNQWARWCAADHAHLNLPRPAH